MQELAVVCLVGHVVMYDQAAIYIDHALHVVAGCLGRTSIAHRPRVGLAKDQSRLVAILQDVLPAHEPVLAAPEGLDRSGERLPMFGLIVEPLVHCLIYDVEPLKLVGDLLFGVRNVTGKPVGASDVL